MMEELGVLRGTVAAATTDTAMPHFFKCCLADAVLHRKVVKSQIQMNKIR